MIVYGMARQPNNIAQHFPTHEERQPRSAKPNLPSSSLQSAPKASSLSRRLLHSSSSLLFSVCSLAFSLR